MAKVPKKAEGVQANSSEMDIQEDEQDGTVQYKSRVVLKKGYVMILGVEYTESFSPVTTDTTVRVTISMMLYCADQGWLSEMTDIEVAFLNADLESNMHIFAEWPEGMIELGFNTEQEREGNCIELTRPIHGGVDVPRLFMKTLKQHLVEEVKLVQSLGVPLLLAK
jgi:Reverse transcriptase (RNA-dependent DNA polymerase)